MRGSDPVAHSFYSVVELVTRPLFVCVVAGLYVAAAVRAKRRNKPKPS
jgi:hypothetical protein